MSTLSTQIDGQILFVSFESREFANSFGVDEAMQLSSILKSHRKRVKACVFRSRHPRIFSAGGNLKFYASHKSRSPGLAVNRRIRKVLDEFSEWAVPKVAVVEGDVWGGGLELLSCFDYRLATPNVLFGFWQRRIGLSFGWGGYRRWGRRLAIERLRELCLSTRVIGAASAKELGLIQEVCSFSEISIRAQAWILQALQNDSSSYPRVQALFEKAPGTSQETAIFESLWWKTAHRKVLEKYKSN